MAAWMMWFIVAAVLVVLELATGTLYLLMLAIGVAAGGMAALVGAGIETQILVTAIVGSAVILALRRSRFGRLGKTEAGRDPNVNLDVGQHVTVENWNSVADGACTARAMYRGSFWDIELAPGATAKAGSFVIREVRGNRLIVSNNGSAALNDPVG